MKNHHAIAMKAVSLSYQEGEIQHKVLENLNLAVSAGEKIAILGRSGSGKTTLLNLISGLITANSGEYFALNENIFAMSEKQRLKFRRYHIGYIFQYYNLIPTLTAFENIEFALQLVGRAKYKQQAIDHCKQLGLASCLHKLPEQLSGGQQQRVAIIRALALAPKIILADEPTGNLDEETGNQVAKLLFESVSETKTTVILVTHAKDLAALSDRQYLLHNGNLVDL